MFVVAIDMSGFIHDQRNAAAARCCHGQSSPRSRRWPIGFLAGWGHGVTHLAAHSGLLGRGATRAVGPEQLDVQ
jgi:hypothetical protein